MNVLLASDSRPRRLCTPRRRLTSTCAARRFAGTAGICVPVSMCKYATAVDCSLPAMANKQVSHEPLEACRYEHAPQKRENRAASQDPAAGVCECMLHVKPQGHTAQSGLIDDKDEPHIAMQPSSPLRADGTRILFWAVGRMRCYTDADDCPSRDGYLYERKREITMLYFAAD